MVKPPSTYHGIALVATLAILTILGVLAASFAVYMMVEQHQSTVQREAILLDLLLADGLEHAKACLVATDLSPGTQDAVPSPEQCVTKNQEAVFGPWIYVKDDTGVIQGRYRVRLEDEAGKVNLSKAFLLSSSRGSGWDTGEIELSRALSISVPSAQNIVEYRYGRDKVPGDRGDDDRNNVLLMADILDNDADGRIDESNEGVNDPREYSAIRPFGDDRRITSIHELMDIIFTGRRSFSPEAMALINREFPRRATLYSMDMPGSATLPNDQPADVNTVTARECRRRLDSANNITPFEPRATRRNQLAVNIVDYRDENHVLSTLGSVYGVEAICFNEMMANDASSTYWLRDACIAKGVIDYVVGKAGSWKKGFWDGVYGSIDKQRIAYSLTWPYCMVPSHGWYQFDPRQAWRVNPSRLSSTRFEVHGGQINFTLPDAPGSLGRVGQPRFASYSQPGTLPGTAKWDWGSRPPGHEGHFHAWGWDSGSNMNDLYKELMKVLGRRGLALSGHPRLPPNTFKNSHAMFYEWNGRPIGCYKVLSSAPDHKFVVSSTDVNTGKSFVSRMQELGINYTNDLDISVLFNAWHLGFTAELPNVNGVHMVRSRRPIGGRYFKVMITREPKGCWSGYKIDTLGLGGTVNSKSFSRQKNKLWYYQDGKPVRADDDGWIDVYITSSPDINRNKYIEQSLMNIRLIAPEVVEMYNASDRPISLANWRVICNTGTLASEIGRIRQTSYYDPALRQRVLDDNPVVEPGGHFYLVNDTRLFDAQYGNADGLWGTAADEEVPVFQMDEDRWGVSYTVASVENRDNDMIDVTVENENFDEDMFAHETVQFLFDDERATDPKSYHGVTMPTTWGNKRNLFTFYLAHDFTLPDTGGKIMIMGIPYSGGIVSLTLKDQYEQICARTVNYGSVKDEEIEFSSEKIDPTKPYWVTRREASIGGTQLEARNQAMRSQTSRGWYIKNAPFGGVAELHKVSSPGTFESVGAAKSKAGSRKTLAAIANVFSASDMRLESCGTDVEHSGWQEAMGEVAGSSLRSVTARSADWETDQWKGHRIRFITGALRGESFPVFGNSENTIHIADEKSESIPRSAPGRKNAKLQAGDLFTLGPAYNSPFCYTRVSGQPGEWFWRRRIHTPGTYYLYIYGVNDAIATTEFLEENYNSSIDVEVWNYNTDQFDLLRERAKYSKEDCFNAGLITPDHISPDGDLRIRLTSHDVVEQAEEGQGQAIQLSKRRSGYAWFNYAVVSPMPVPGRVNANTAPPRLLSSLPGISPELAHNIAEGIDNNGKPVLKPYKHLGDVLDVQDMTLDTFERCANLLTVSSRIFTVEVEAQTLNPGTADTPGALDTISAARQKRYIVELDGDPGTYCRVSDIERYNP